MTDWVFLRGLTRESRHWGALTTRWQAAGLGAPLLVDLPGNGTLWHEESPATVPGFVASVRQSLRQAGQQRPVRVLAMSLGAMVAAEWARRQPEEVAALVLINTSMRPFSTITERLQPANWPGLLRMAGVWGNRVYCEATIHRMTCARVDTQDADLEAWKQIATSAPVSRRAALRQLLAAARYRTESMAPCPTTLLIASEADRLVNPVCSAQLAQAWSVPLLRHPWAGHDLPHDDPDWLCAVVARQLTAAA
ncbi:MULTISPECIES: alpha/beta fold hydrolase [Cupriavidus]|uniref:Hydrolase, alpha/beta fold family n=1 Tax=Cupriavidus pinatubonensis (strain JMP 134 / LMG 1197) TaxID=264198 RepID=Q46T91_CUPPJ|nr:MULTISPECIES: alpha/beta hydrolase [Cupriavidus]TPQ41400.1 alpha/beta hydrolase [Cupriavidus pinatubonensis]